MKEYIQRLKAPETLKEAHHAYNNPQSSLRLKRCGYVDNPLVLLHCLYQWLHQKVCVGFQAPFLSFGHILSCLEILKEVRFIVA
ncbi:hypothetical protein [Helicobacter apodemus]|uniref:hypothetical protein n=1 Tax=Helicobacter apodemus TaxID=135569 RepID=UPI001EF3BF77|nr:hypothetical protein [Helicobacter apodemus]